jgi:hypothetical protein
MLGALQTDQEIVLERVDSAWEWLHLENEDEVVYCVRKRGEEVLFIDPHTSAQVIRWRRLGSGEEWLLHKWSKK